MKLKMISLNLILSLSLLMGGCSVNVVSSSVPDDSETQEKTAEDQQADISVPKGDIFTIKETFTEAIVTGVGDGDSVYIELSNLYDYESRELYLEGINAPEINDPIFKEMPFGQESKENLECLIKEGDKIYLDIVGDPDALVLYAYAYIDDGHEVVQLNYEQASTGMAYVKENVHVKGDDYSKLKTVQDKSKLDKIGIWSEEDLVVQGLFNEKYLTNSGKFYSREELEEGYK